ncbi:hypothetical protein JC221_243 [Yersinia phage JC221]|nr:hypothetical protein JC221_243 [Yersinia phage JC221]
MKTAIIKRRGAGSYYVANSDLDINIRKSEETGNWIVVGGEYGDSCKTKKEAVEYANWILNFKG